MPKSKKNIGRSKIEFAETKRDKNRRKKQEKAKKDNATQHDKLDYIIELLEGDR